MNQYESLWVTTNDDGTWTPHWIVGQHTYLVSDFIIKEFVDEHNKRMLEAKAVRDA